MAHLLEALYASRDQHYNWWQRMQEYKALSKHWGSYKLRKKGRQYPVLASDEVGADIGEICLTGARDKIENVRVIKVKYIDLCHSSFFQGFYFQIFVIILTSFVCHSRGQSVNKTSSRGRHRQGNLGWVTSPEVCGFHHVSLQKEALQSELPSNLDT